MVIDFIDLFAGIGGFRLAAEQAAGRLGVGHRCVFSSELDGKCAESYRENFGHWPSGDITKIPSCDIPRHDLLLAGFPCQPFSVIGRRLGFDDTRGTMFFEIARILESSRPRMFVLENVKALAGHDKGRTLSTILDVLGGLGYHVWHKVLDARDFGLPQKRERIWIVGCLDDIMFEFPSYDGAPRTLEDILEVDPDRRHFLSGDMLEVVRAKVDGPVPAGRTIWHVNKSNHVGIHNWSCALRAGASHNYLLVDGVRRLTSREMLRLQGFPDSHKIIHPYSVVKHQAGNSLPVPVAEAVVRRLLESSKWRLE